MNFSFKQQRRFWKKVNFQNPTSIGCWLWSGSVLLKGLPYGRFSIVYPCGTKKTKCAHRISYMLSYGIDPGDLLILHKCDVPQCVNPEHLFLGTHKDNTQDMFKKNRQQDTKGTNNAMSKITMEQVNEIRELYKTGNYSQTSLGKKYNLTQTSISRIIRNKNWKF